MNNYFLSILLFIVSFSSAFAQSINSDSLRSVGHERDKEIQRMNKITDEKIKWIQESNLSEEEKNTLFEHYFSTYGINSFEEFISEYYRLRELDKSKADSLDMQLVKLDSLIQELNINKRQNRLTKFKLDSLKRDNEILKSIMKNYLSEWESLESNIPSEIKDAKPFYFNINDFKKSKIYYFESHGEVITAQYRKITSKPRKNLLITEVYDESFKRIECYVEKIDSLGSHILKHKLLKNNKLIKARIIEDDLFLWTSNSTYKYSENYCSATLVDSFTYFRQFLRVDSIPVLGKTKPVAVFKDVLENSVSTLNDTISKDIYSYFSNGYGLVRYDYVRPLTNYTYQMYTLNLLGILTKKEWRKIK